MPLDQATTQDLVAELRRRYPHLLIVGENFDMPPCDAERSGIARAYGSLTVMLGLHQRLGFMLDESLASAYDDRDQSE